MTEVVSRVLTKEWRKEVVGRERDRLQNGGRPRLESTHRSMDVFISTSIQNNLEFSTRVETMVYR